MEAKQLVFGLLRISLGWIFLWSFFDKVFGLGFATEAGKGWLDGVSSTSGFLQFASRGPFADFYHSLAGSAAVDWLFMIGLICIGLCLLLGVVVKIAAWAGAIMLLLVFTAVLPPEHNPVIDEHVIYALILIMLSFIPAGSYLGLGRIWKQTAPVQRFPWLE